MAGYDHGIDQNQKNENKGKSNIALQYEYYNSFKH